MQTEDVEFELQALVDATRTAVRAARAYASQVTLIDDKPLDLCSDRCFRDQALDTLSCLQRASQKKDVRTVHQAKEAVRGWLLDVHHRLDSEVQMDQQAALFWSEGDWSGRALERCWHFLKFYDPSHDDLPNPSYQKREFLEELRNGIRLVLIHNAFVRRSKRPFGQISRHHIDTERRYRATDNLKYWNKALEYRFQVTLADNASGWDAGQVFDGTAVGQQMLLEAVLVFVDVVIREISGEYQKPVNLSPVGINRGEEKLEAETETETETETEVEVDIDALEVASVRKHLGLVHLTIENDHI